MGQKNKIKIFFNKIVDSGTRENDDFMLSHRMRLLNLVSVLNMVVIFGFGIYLFILNDKLGAGLCFYTSVFNLTTYLLVNKRRFKMGKWVFSIANYLTIICVALLYGRESGAYIVLIFLIIALMLLFEKRKKYIPLFLICVLTFVALEYYFDNSMSPEYRVGYEHIYYVILFLSLCYLVILIDFFKNQDSAYREYLESKNAELLKYFLAINQTSATIIITSANGEIEYANPQFEKTTGYTTEEALGLNPRFLNSGKTPKNTFDELWQTITKGKIWKGEFINRKKNGEKYIEHAVIAPVINANSEITNYIAIKEDITAKREIENALAQSENKYRLLAENSNDVIWTFDIKKQIMTYISPAIERMRGLSIKEAMEETLDQKFEPESLERIKNSILSVVNFNEPYEQFPEIRDEFQERCKDGKIIDVEINACIIPDKNGLPKELLGISHDITERKEAERTLQAGKAKLSEMLEVQTSENQRLLSQLNYIYNNSSIAIAFFKIEKEKISFSSCNNLWAKNLGYLPKNLQGKDIANVLDSETEKLHRSLITQAINNNNKMIDSHVHWKNKYLYVNIIPIYNTQSNKNDFCASFISDLTEKHQIEQKMNEMAQRFFTIFNKSSNAIALINSEFEITLVNESFLKIYKSKDYPKTNIVKKYFPKVHQKEVYEKLLKVKNGETISSFDVECVDVNKALIPVEISISLLSLNNQPVILCIIRDISIRKNMEATVLQVSMKAENKEKQKLSTDLHDNVGPLLSSLKMYLSVLRRELKTQNQNKLMLDINRILQETISTVHEISNDLNPMILTNYGLTSAINLFFETKTELVELKIKNTIGNLRFNEVKEIMVYSIIKEAFNNTLKHANASRVWLEIGKKENRIEITYSDNGIGFNFNKEMAEAGNALGLLSIVNRITVLDGKYNIISTPGNGFVLSFSFSVNN